MRVMKTASVVALTAMAIAATLTTAANAQAIHGVQGSFDAMNAWLDGSEHADGWRDYLKTDELRQQLELGDDADVDILKEHLQRYSGGTAGLYKVRFRDVRDSLRLWIGELELPAESELGDIATKAVDNVYPINPSRLQSAQSQMESSGRSLDNFLRQGGVEKEEGWKNFLKWNDYSEALAQDPIDYPTLVRVWAITASDTPGLQYSQFANYREGLRRYLELREFFDDEDSALVNLPDRLAAYQDEPNEQTAAELGQTLGWFARTSQHSNVVKSIHRHYSKPNLFANFSERLVIHGFTQDVDENEAVNSYLNGNSTEGDAHTAASITAQLSPNGRNGEVIVSMDGNIESTTKTTAGNGATYDTTGKTTIDAEKPVLFTQRGITGQASEVKCEAEHETSNIEASSPQVEDALRQRLDNSKQQREFQAARRAEQQVKADLDSRVNERVQDANDQLEQDFFLPMMRRGVRPRALQYSSTSDRLYQFMTIAAPEHLAAPSDPPEVDLEGDVVARVHTSWLNNFADISLRGTLLTDIGLAEALEDWRGEVPEELRITEESEPWDITLAVRRPLWIKVNDDRLKLTLRGERFTARDRVSNEPMHISAEYNIKREGGEVKLTRDGDVKVTFPDQGEKLSVRYVSMRRFWQTKFSALFEEEFDGLNLNLSGAWETAGPLKLTALNTHAGDWLGLSWDMPSEEAVAAARAKEQAEAKAEEGENTGQ